MNRTYVQWTSVRNRADTGSNEYFHGGERIDASDVPARMDFRALERANFYDEIN